MVDFVQTGVHPRIEASIGKDGPDLGIKYRLLEWSSFVNAGYIVRITVDDVVWNSLRGLTGGGGSGGIPRS